MPSWACWAYIACITNQDEIREDSDYTKGKRYLRVLAVWLWFQPSARVQSSQLANALWLAAPLVWTSTHDLQLPPAAQSEHKSIQSLAMRLFLKPMLHQWCKIQFVTWNCHLHQKTSAGLWEGCSQSSWPADLSCYLHHMCVGLWSIVETCKGRRCQRMGLRAPLQLVFQNSLVGPLLAFICSGKGWGCCMLTNIHLLWLQLQMMTQNKSRPKYVFTLNPAP